MYDRVSQQYKNTFSKTLRRIVIVEKRLALSRYQLSSRVRRILEDGIISTGGTGNLRSKECRREEDQREKEEKKEKNEEDEGKALVRRATRQLQNCKN